MASGDIFHAEAHHISEYITYNIYIRDIYDIVIIIMWYDMYNNKFMCE